MSHETLAVITAYVAGSVSMLGFLQGKRWIALVPPIAAIWCGTLLHWDRVVELLAY